MAPDRPEGHALRAMMLRSMGRLADAKGDTTLRVIALTELGQSLVLSGQPQPALAGRTGPSQTAPP